jgi:hypothetical protein
MRPETGVDGVTTGLPDLLFTLIVVGGSTAGGTDAPPPSESEHTELGPGPQPLTLSPSVEERTLLSPPTLKRLFPPLSKLSALLEMTLSVRSWPIFLEIK